MAEGVVHPTVEACSHSHLKLYKYMLYSQYSMLSKSHCVKLQIEISQLYMKESLFYWKNIQVNLLAQSVSCIIRHAS